MSENKVLHDGVVVAISGKELKIKIEARAACGSCAIKSACGMSETKEKEIVVANDKTGEFNVGDKVTVAMRVSQGDKAAIYAYLIPTVILIVAILVLATFGLNEGIVALAAVALLVPYYLILYYNRNKLKEKFSFDIIRKDD